MRDFLLPTSGQVDSRLIWLPIELRTKILRLLLRTLEPLPASAAYNCKADFQLSSQILRCCQTLYDETHHILYKENVLSVDCTSDLPVHALVLLDCVVYLPVYPLLSAKSVTDLESAAQNDAQNCPEHQFHYERCSRIIPALSKFDRMHVNFKPNFDSLQEISSPCRLLRSIATRKRIKVNLPELQSSIPSLSAWVKCFQWWRCKSIEFHGLSDETTKDVVSVVTGSQPVVDLYPGVSELQEVFENISVQAYEIQSPDPSVEDYLTPPECFDWNAYRYCAHHNDLRAFENMADSLVKWKVLVTDRAIEKVMKAGGREIEEMESADEGSVAKIRFRVDDEVTALRTEANEITDRVARVKACLV